MSRRLIVALTGSIMITGTAPSLLAQSGTPTPTPTDTSTATVVGTVFDSLADKPLSGAVVQFVSHTAGSLVYSAQTDSAGVYRIPHVRHGEYMIGFLHPALDSLGLDPPLWRIVVRNDTTHANLATASGTTLRTSICHPSNPADSSGVMLGFVRDADTGEPLGGSSVVVVWNELLIDHGIHRERRQIPGKTSPKGWYAICGIPSDAEVSVRAEMGPRASGYVELQVPLRGALHRDFGIPAESAAVAVADSSAPGSTPFHRGTAQLTGVVRGPDGKLLASAQLLVWGTGVTGATTSDGTFSLANLPPGTETLEVRYVGFAPKHVVVDLMSHHTTSVAVTLSEPVAVLSSVTVYGKKRRDINSLGGFYDRMQRGFGHFVTAGQLDNAVQLSDAFYGIPGVMVSPSGSSGYDITMRGSAATSCRPTYYLDGTRMGEVDNIDQLVPPQQVVGIEVYEGPAETPALYQGQGCGVIAIWTGIRAAQHSDSTSR